MMGPGAGVATLLLARLDGLDLAARFDPTGRVTDLVPDVPGQPDLTGQVVWARARRSTAGWWVMDLGPDREVGVLPIKGAGDLAPSQCVPVQITHSPAEVHKHVRLTRDLALSGRLCVYRPFGTSHQVARTLPAGERTVWSDRLSTLDRRGSWIVRSRAADHPPDAVLAEAIALADRWEGDRPSGAVGSVLLPAPSLGRAALIDGADASVILVAPPLSCPTDLPSGAPKPYALTDREAAPWLDSLSQTVVTASHPTIPLQGGGAVTIQNTRALTAVDVDAPDGGRRAEAINRQAIAAIAQAVRLRNIGGIVVADLLKMPNPDTRAAVMRAFSTALADDPHTVALSPRLSPLGLAEFSRARRGRSLDQALRLAEVTL